MEESRVVLAGVAIDGEMPVVRERLMAAVSTLGGGPARSADRIHMSLLRRYAGSTWWISDPRLVAGAALALCRASGEPVPIVQIKRRHDESFEVSFGVWEIDNTQTWEPGSTPSLPTWDAPDSDLDPAWGMADSALAHRLGAEPDSGLEEVWITGDGPPATDHLLPPEGQPATFAYEDVKQLRRFDFYRHIDGRNWTVRIDEDDLEGHVDPQQTLIPTDRVVALFHYPMTTAWEFEIQGAPYGITRGDIVRQVQQIYRRIYAEEALSLQGPEQRSPTAGPLNRGLTDGKYGIYGHDLEWLHLEGAVVGFDPAGRIVLILDIGS